MCVRSLEGIGQLKRSSLCQLCNWAENGNEQLLISLIVDISDSNQKVNKSTCLVICTKERQADSPRHLQEVVSGQSSF